MVLRGVGELLSLCSVLTCCRWWPAECPAEPGMWRPFGRKAARIAHAGSGGVLWLIVALQDSYDKSLSRLEHQRNIVCIRASDCKAKYYTARSVGHRTCHKRGLTQWQTEDQHNGSRLSYTIWGPIWGSPTDFLLSMRLSVSIFSRPDFYEHVEVKACRDTVNCRHDFTLSPSLG